MQVYPDDPLLHENIQAVAENSSINHIVQSEWDNSKVFLGGGDMKDS